MNKKISIMLAAGIMMAGVPAATAATPQSSGRATMSQPLSDIVSLTKTQRTMAWNDLQRHATEQKAPSSFEPTVGSVVPSKIKIEPVPSKAASDIPSLKPYDFTMVHGKLLIVNPSDKKVAAVFADTMGS